MQHSIVASLYKFVYVKKKLEVVYNTKLLKILSVIMDGVE